MKKVLFLTAVLFLTSCSTLNKLGIKPSAIETALALKEVLNSSTFRTIRALKDMSDDSGVIPDKMNTVLAGLNTLGYGEEAEKVKLQISKASAIALTETEGIVTDAIKELKFKDAAAIVLGGQNAATGVLKNAMYITVKNRYSNQLDQVLQGQEATQYWPIAASAYNLFASEKVDGKLSDFLAERAVDALFLTMGKNESAIRTNYKDLGNQVVTKVFDYYTKEK